MCIANLDIFLDDGGTNWLLVDQVVRSNIVLCQSRIEFSPPATTYKDASFASLAFANAQDAWFFESPIVVPDCAFEIGTLGCDNAIAERIKRAGRIPINSPNQFKIFHYDQCRGKTGATTVDFHSRTSGQPNRRPEDQGHYLIPDIDQMRSVDALMSSLRVPELLRYQVICDTLNRLVRVNNRLPEARANNRPASAMSKIVFYNHWHNGDVYLSRGVVADIVARFPDKTFACAHGCAADLLADIEGLAFDGSLLGKLPASAMNSGYIADPAADTLFLNTWIGTIGIENVHRRGGSSVQLLREAMTPGLRESLGIEPPPLESFLPEPRWSKFHIAGVDSFVACDARPKVLVCNGTIRSNQSGEFAFGPVIEHLAKVFPGIVFIATNPTSSRRGNVLHSAEIIGKAGSDLNENGYLSTFCDVIVGRSSGAYTFALNKTNVRSRKTFVGFTVRAAEATLGFHGPEFAPQCRFVWSNDFAEASAIKVIRQAIEERLAVGRGV